MFPVKLGRFGQAREGMFPVKPSEGRADRLGPGMSDSRHVPRETKESDPTLDRAGALGQHGATRARVNE
jgi:hypothetical protein